MDFTIREATAEDDDQVAWLLEAMTRVYPPGTSRGFALWTKRGYCSGSQASRLLVAEETGTGKVVGTSTVYIEQKAGGSAAHIEDVVVEVGSRHLDVGTALVAECVGYARERGCYKVVLDCKPELIPFYEQCGFGPGGVCMRMDLDAKPGEKS